MFRLCCILIGYAIGCIQTSYIAGRLTKNIDIRDFGSGNAGTTNTMRVLGRKAGFAVLALDILKGMAGFAICMFLFGSATTFFIFNSGSYEPYFSFSMGSIGGGIVSQSVVPWVLPGLYGGLGVVLGHDFPFFLRFRGGKGIASTLGIMLCADWRAALLAYACGVVVLLTTCYVSLASLIILAVFTVLMAAFGHGAEALAVTAVLTIIAYVQHRGNIERLAHGTERKITLRRK